MFQSMCIEAKCGFVIIFLFFVAIRKDKSIDINMRIERENFTRLIILYCQQAMKKCRNPSTLFFVSNISKVSDSKYFYCKFYILNLKLGISEIFEFIHFFIDNNVLNLYLK